MRNAAFFFILFLAIPASAQPPVIDSMLIDESKGILSIYGDFGGAKGKVWCDSVELPIVSWSDSLITANLPPSGKGSSGPVIVGGKGYQSKPQIITHWYCEIHRIHNVHHQTSIEQNTDDYYLSWRYDIEQWFRTRFPVRVVKLLTQKSKHNTWSDYFGTISTSYDDNYFTLVRLNLVALPKQQNAHIGVYPFDSYAPELTFDSLLNFIPGDTVIGNFGISTGYQWSGAETAFPPSSNIIVLANQPILRGPSNFSRNINFDSIQFQWDTMRLMDRYRLQISTDSLFQTYFMDTTIFTPNLTLQGLSKDYKYFWRVCGVNSEGESRWSEVWSFTTGEQADVKEQQQREAMLSCYPNPASKEITIRYTLADASPAKILLYDMSGKLCKSQDIFPGRSEARLDVSELASGMYVVGVVSAAGRESRLVEILR